MTDPNPFTISESAVALHELYISFKDAGFTESEAFELVKAVLVAGVRSGQEDPE